MPRSWWHLPCVTFPQSSWTGQADHGSSSETQCKCHCFLWDVLTPCPRRLEGRVLFLFPPHVYCSCFCCSLSGAKEKAEQRSSSVPVGCVVQLFFIFPKNPGIWVGNWSEIDLEVVADLRSLLDVIVLLAGLLSKQEDPCRIVRLYLPTCSVPLGLPSLASLSLTLPLLLSSPGGLRRCSQHPDSLLGLQSDLWDQTLGGILELPLFSYPRCLGKCASSCMENPNDADGLRNG